MVVETRDGLDALMMEVASILSQLCQLPSSLLTHNAHIYSNSPPTHKTGRTRLEDARFCSTSYLSIYLSAYPHVFPRIQNGIRRHNVHPPPVVPKLRYRGSSSAIFQPSHLHLPPHLTVSHCLFIYDIYPHSHLSFLLRSFPLVYVYNSPSCFISVSNNSRLYPLFLYIFLFADSPKNPVIY